MTCRCVPFPHSHLFCGQYIDASTVVYIDNNVFNYTEANNRIIELDNNDISGPGIMNSCRWIVLYMICISIYPQCNITTKALVPPCMEDCLKYTDLNGICGGNIRTLLLIAMDRLDSNSLDKNLVLNCSAPFRAFSSVNIDSGNCYNFNCKLFK